MKVVMLAALGILEGMIIPFTQYLRPDGRTRPTHFAKNDPEIVMMAKALLKAGYRFTVEELMTGEVSMTCEHVHNDEDVIGMEVCMNGPEVPVAVGKMIREASGVLNPKA